MPEKSTCPIRGSATVKLLVAMADSMPNEKQRVHIHLLDCIWQKHRLEGKLHAHLVRYADDFVVLCALDVKEPQKVVYLILARLDLSLNEAKTHIVDTTKESFHFLGFSIRMNKGMRTGKPYPHVCPSMTRHKVKNRGIGEGGLPSVQLY